MELTRRDALLALGGLGLTTATWAAENHRSDAELSEDRMDALVAVAETLYPSEVSVSTEFVETYVAGQRELDEDHAANVADAVDTVRRRSRRETGSGLQSLDPEQRGAIIRATGADRAYPDPDGTEAERIRYYVVNNLLFALYSTPRGGKLVGNPNPPGYPGGVEAYQEATTDE